MKWIHTLSLKVGLLSRLQWHHNWRNNVSNNQPHHCLLSRLFRRRSKKISKLRATGLCAGNSPGTGEFPAQMATKAENISIWWRHHANQAHTLGSQWSTSIILITNSLGLVRFGAFITFDDRSQFTTGSQRAKAVNWELLRSDEMEKARRVGVINWGLSENDW